jgi:hypothetical protein
MLGLRLVNLSVNKLPHRSSGLKNSIATSNEAVL